MNKELYKTIQEQILTFVSIQTPTTCVEYRAYQSFLSTGIPFYPKIASCGHIYFYRFHPRIAVRNFQEKPRGDREIPSKSLLYPFCCLSDFRNILTAEKILNFRIDLFQYGALYSKCSTEYYQNNKIIKFIEQRTILHADEFENKN